ncbi:MAG: hypothetical protein A2297_03615 [Elusimicrobia bacterium RIFOXYB2_FULL_48_7]|nr:MAG: hypothetical protein A2297_03615 [Elusimicrobia bacterium RIFOXYB2_FULL_48_7]
MKKEKPVKFSAESESEFLKIFNFSPAISTITTFDDGRFVEVNNAFLKVTGYRREEVIGKRTGDLNMVSSKIRRASRQELKKNGFAITESDVRMKDGAVKTGLFYARTMLFRNELCIIQSVVDITGRKKSEELLKESEARYRTLFDQAVDGVIIMPLDGSTIIVNGSFAKMHGYASPEEMASMRLQDLDTPETAKLAPERLKKIREGKLTSFEVEHYRKDGSIFPVSVSCNVVKYGDKSYYLGFHRDITEREKNRGLLEKQKKELESKNIALRELIAQVEIEKRQIKENLVSNIERTVLPLAAKVAAKAGNREKKYMEILEENLKKIAEPFTSAAKVSSGALSPRELEISNMIRNGHKSKKIARILGISPDTVHTIRRSIRRKLGITGKPRNLGTTLQQQ